MNEDKIFGYLGLATKAGKVVSGEFMTEKSVKNGKAKIVIVAADASDNTREMFQNMCDYYHVQICFMSDKETLGRVIGKQFRASLAVTDDGFAKAIKKQIT